MVISFIDFCGGFFRLSLQTFRELFERPFYPKLLMEQLYYVGVKSFFLVAVSGLATGSVMALQYGFGLQKFGGTLYVPKISSLTILREMGPVFASLLVSGRVGSGIAAEVASMKVTQQIDAIRALGTSPIKRIVIPRLLACIIAFPVLTLFANYVALWGAMLICKTELNISADYFYAKTLDTISIADLTTGMIKTVVFAYFISITACLKGFKSEGGTQGVGDTTTWVVVASSVFIMISDFFLTKIFVMTLYPTH